MTFSVVGNIHESSNGMVFRGVRRMGKGGGGMENDRKSLVPMYVWVSFCKHA